MSVSEVPPTASPDPASGQQEALIQLVVTIVQAALPELLRANADLLKEIVSGGGGSKGGDVGGGDLNAEGLTTDDTFDIVPDDVDEED